MELEEAAHGTLAQVRISVVTENAEGGGTGRSQQQPPPPPASDWGYLANLRSVAEAEPASAGGTATAAAAATSGLPQAERYGAGRKALSVRSSDDQKGCVGLS